MSETETVEPTTLDEAEAALKLIDTEVNVEQLLTAMSPPADNPEGNPDFTKAAGIASQMAELFTILANATPDIVKAAAAKYEAEKQAELAAAAPPPPPLTPEPAS